MSLINIGGLVVGMSVCLTLLLYVDYESGFDDFHSSDVNIYRIFQQKQFPDDLYYFNTTPYPLAQALEKDIPESSQTAQLSGPVSKDLKVKVNGVPKIFAIQNLAFVSDNYFDFF
ncbi:MAG: ABC transporter permease [Nonlabens sp.]